MFAVTGIEFNLTSVASVLMILGYSVNDTVVIYDYIRENRRKFKKMPWAELIDLSVNETLSRTIITGGTGILALGALMIWGGPTMFPFVFAMVFGIIVGTYSSIYVAAPALLLSGSKVPADRKGDDDQPAGARQAG
jgi:preprotein translocase SecF subunit